MKGDYRIMEVKFTIPGKPTGKARPRFSRYRSIAYTPKSTVAYESLVQLRTHMRQYFWEYKLYYDNG